MIAPSYSELFKRKLELQNIEFIQADQVIDQISTALANSTSSTLEKIIETKSTSSLYLTSSNAVNINTAKEDDLITASQGWRIRTDQRKKLINNRKNNPYKDLTHLVSDLKFGNNIKAKLQEKLDQGEICF
ncbi:MAG: hypothetical protein AAGJ08_11540 [Cyanobacteria bacterium P01_H01_bin.35]